MDFVLEGEEVSVRVSDMEGDSSILGEEDCDARMVNDDEKDGSGEDVSDEVMEDAGVIEGVDEPMPLEEDDHDGPTETEGVEE